MAYDRAIEWLENAQPSDLRAQDVMQIIRLYMDAVKTFSVEPPKAEDDWTEEDEARMEDILNEIDEEGPSEDEEDLL